LPRLTPLGAQAHPLKRLSASLLEDMLGQADRMKGWPDKLVRLNLFFYRGK
jgi:hypothetical protein